MTVTLTVLIFWIYLFIYSNPSICSTVVVCPLGNSEVVVSLFSGFPSNSRWDPLFTTHVMTIYADLDDLHDHLRDVPWDDIYKLDASAATTEFCKWIWVEIYVYLPCHKYHIKPNSSP